MLNCTDDAILLYYLMKLMSCGSLPINIYILLYTIIYRELLRVGIYFIELYVSGLYKRGEGGYYIRCRNVCIAFCLSLPIPIFIIRTPILPYSLSYNLIKVRSLYE